MNREETIRRNVDRVRAELAEAALARGRSAQAVRLVAVTKEAGWDEIAALASLDQRDLGENRAEQLIERSQEAAKRGLDVSWHMIGHLQRRKARGLLSHAALIHSLDSLRLGEEIEKRAAARAAESREEKVESSGEEVEHPQTSLGVAPAGGERVEGHPQAGACGCHPTQGHEPTCPPRAVGMAPSNRSMAASGHATPSIAVLVEVNIAGEEQKYGVRVEEAEGLVRALGSLAHLEVRGLMTMAPLVDDAERVRGVFRALRELRDRLNDRGVYPRALTELSMGMSQDYRVAAEEGATMVRVGRALFE